MQTYVIFFIAAFTFGLLVNKVLLGFARTLGIRRNHTEIIRWNSAAKPSLGGIAFFIVFLLSIAAVPVFSVNIDQIYTFKHIGIIFGASLSFIMGLADDAYNTRPLLKFLTQLFCGFVLIYSGIVINISEYIFINYGLTLLWVVGIMNSLNMLDNMDGITTITAITITIFLIAAYFLQVVYDPFLLVILVGLLAVLLSFLFFNFPPSKMFMGDTGSQFLGFILAALSIVLIWNQNGVYSFDVPLFGLVLTITVFTMSIVDTTIVSIVRIAKGGSPFVGGKDHTTHRLSYLNFSERQVALVVLLVQSVAITLAYYALKSPSINRLLLLAGYFLLILLIFTVITQKTTVPDE